MRVKNFLMMGLSLAILSGAGIHSAFSDDTLTATPAINPDAIQARAEELLHSEPGATEAKVRVEVSQDKDPNRIQLNLWDFDTNKDGVLDRDEVGEKLFKFFDTDGNEVIDNKEMLKPSIIVFTPMTKKTIEMVNFQADGQAAKETVTEEKFLQRSNLSKFDTDKDGLSPLDFLGKPFNVVNVHKDGVIDLYEWKRAYAASARPMHLEYFNYNQ